MATYGLPIQIQTGFQYWTYGTVRQKQEIHWSDKSKPLQRKKGTNKERLREEEKRTQAQEKDEVEEYGVNYKRADVNLKRKGSWLEKLRANTLDKESFKDSDEKCFFFYRYTKVGSSSGAAYTWSLSLAANLPLNTIAF